NYFEVRKALLAVGRHDLIGSGCDALISAQPPKAALQARMAKTRSELTEGRYVHTIAKPATKTPRAASPERGPGSGYRPHRKTARRRPH
ncbi:MAG TPA: YgiQ family radical SAM protein, partial [Isosphaeraceae bacterium]|nr:YgiQ family radical SAM protein [Isosphaeraceae bacterium]